MHTPVTTHQMNVSSVAPFIVLSLIVMMHENHKPAVMLMNCVTVWKGSIITVAVANIL